MRRSLFLTYLSVAFWAGIAFALFGLMVILGNREDVGFHNHWLVGVQVVAIPVFLSLIAGGLARILVLLERIDAGRGRKEG